MIQRLIILLGISVLLMTSCQNDDFIPEPIPGEINGETVPVNFSMSLHNSTEYEPMSRNASTDTIAIGSTFNYIIVQNIDSKKVIERVGQGEIQAPTSYFGWKNVKIDGVNTFPALSINMRPGDYEIMIFTGAKTVEWNTSLRPGTVLPETNTPENPIPAACVYQPNSFWTYDGEKALTEEVFFGRQGFTVTKTNDLHSYPNQHQVGVPLERRVTKFRVLLKDVAAPGGTRFADGNPIAILIKADIIVDPSTPLADGLDVWGNLWYNNVAPLLQYKYITMTHSAPIRGPQVDSYYISRVSATAYAPYLFCDKNTEIAITITNFDCSARAGSPSYKYYGQHDFTLNWNNIKGIIFKPTDNIDPGTIDFLMEPDYDISGNLADPAILFDANYEHNF